jgi:hypothetical protein
LKKFIYHPAAQPNDTTRSPKAKTAKSAKCHTIFVGSTILSLPSLEQHICFLGGREGCTMCLMIKFLVKLLLFTFILINKKQK